MSKTTFLLTYLLTISMTFFKTVKRPDHLRRMGYDGSAVDRRCYKTKLPPMFEHHTTNIQQRHIQESPTGLS